MQTLLLALMMAGTGAVTHTDGVADHAAIDALYSGFADGYRTLDAGAVAALYTEDAFYLSPKRDIVRGRAAIADDFAAMFKRTRKQQETLAITFHITGREVSGDLAYDVGVFTLVRTRDGAETSRSRGKFVVVARRGEDGAWRFAVDAYSGLPKTP